MKTLGKIAFYILFAFGAIRLFKGLNNLGSLIYAKSENQPINLFNYRPRFNRFGQIEPMMDKSQVILLLVSGLGMILIAFYIRKKMCEKTL